MRTFDSRGLIAQTVPLKMTSENYTGVEQGNKWEMAILCRGHMYSFVRKVKKKKKVMKVFLIGGVTASLWFEPATTWL